jgi:uncharacterized protein YydD (DUF2326 family)
MIQTIRDAESKIWTLQKEVTYFKTKINELENRINELKNAEPTFVNLGTEADSVINSDGTSISHRLYHIFDRIKTRLLEIVDLTLTTLTATTINSTTINNSGAINTATLVATGNIKGGSLTSTVGIEAVNIHATNNISADGQLGLD